jgi:hypothetical protein
MLLCSLVGHHLLLGDFGPYVTHLWMCVFIAVTMVWWSFGIKGSWALWNNIIAVTMVWWSFGIKGSWALWNNIIAVAMVMLLKEAFYFLYVAMYPVWWPGLKNSPTVSHACRKRRLKWVPSAWGYSWATLSPGVINMEAWSSRLGVGRWTKNPAL